MTTLEKYKVEIDTLIDRLDNMSFGFIEEDEMVASKLMADAAQKLEEMMSIIIDVGAANGCLADAFQIMSDDLEKTK